MADAMPWFRMRRAITESVKVFSLTPQRFRHWVLFLCCTDDEGVLADLPTVAHRLRMSLEDTKEALDALVAAKLFDRDKGAFVAHDWDEHNPKTSTQRTRKHRAKKRVGNAGETLGNADGDANATPRLDKSRGDKRTTTSSRTSPRGSGEDDWEPTPEQIDGVFDRWNIMATTLGLARVTPTDERREAVRELMRTLDGPQVIINAFDTIPKQPFLLGKGKQGWRVNFDFIIKPSNFAKLREGFYQQERK